MNEDLQNRFTGEARDLIENLEHEILELEKDPLNSGSIQEIFRVMHTLKGAAAMFGFEGIGEITHHLENIYNEIRDSRFKVNNDVINVTLDTIDTLKLLLEKKENLNKKEQNGFNVLVQRIIDIYELNSEVEVADESDSGKVASIHQDPVADDTNLNLYYIIYHPDKDVFVRGANPYSVFQDFMESGKIHCIPGITSDEIEKHKPVKKFNKEWEIFYHCENPGDKLDFIFMFFTEEEYQVIPLDQKKLDSDLAFKEEYIKRHPEDQALKQVREILRKIGIKDQNSDSSFFEFRENESTEIKTDDSSNRKIMSSGNISNIKVPSIKLDELINLVGELVITNSHLSYLTTDINNIELKKAISQVEKLSKNLRDNTLELRLIPISVLTTKFQRLVRDLSKKLGKQVEFVAEGTETELDSNIINSLDGPLMHIIRNGIDHGIETPDERKKRSKSPRGIIRLSAYYSGANVFISVQDDGKGIDTEYIRNKAVKAGIIPSTAKLGKKDIYDLIFVPGFSTAENLTEVSGRGVGLDVVKKSIIDLRGEVEIDSEKNLGTSFTLKLPLTLSIIDTLLVQINQKPYLIPLSSIESCHKRLHTSLFKDQNKRIEYQNELIPFLYLREEFQLGGDPPEIENIIIINLNEKYYALVVDKVMGEHQAVVKPISYLNKNQEYFSGASVLGNGQLALILDINHLLSKRKESYVNV